jgi:hypothetical protein
MMTGKTRIKNWIKENTGHSEDYEPLVVQKLRVKLKNENMIADVLEIISSVCNNCWDNDHPCTCMRED